MKKLLLFYGIVCIVALGCARVRVKVEAPNEPIKVDISMRLDIYQHVVKDINNIEDIVSGSKDKLKQNSGSFLNNFVTNAYAQDGLSPEIEGAVSRRKERHPGLLALQAKGIIGENKLGLVEIYSPQESTPELENLIKAENSDRMIIYREIAKKNNIPLEDVQKPYAKRLQQDAPVGTAIEILDEETKEYVWQIKK